MHTKEHNEYTHVRGFVSRLNRSRHSLLIKRQRVQLSNRTKRAHRNLALSLRTTWPRRASLWCSRKLLWTLMNKVWPISAYKPSFVRTHQPLHRGRYVIYQTPLADDPVPSYSSAFASLYWFNKELRERKRFLRMSRVPSKTTKAWPHYFFGQIFITAVNLSSTWIMQRALNSHLFLIELLVYPQTPHSEGWSQGQAVWCQLYAK